MNRAERNFLFLALFLFGLGSLSRLGALDRVTPLQPVDLPLAAEPVVLPDSLVETPVVVAAPKSTSGNKKALSAPISINKATAAELLAIKGVGPALAARIVEYRARKGPFRSARDLDKVPGIGQKKLKAICEWVIFD